MKPIVIDLVKKKRKMVKLDLMRESEKFMDYQLLKMTRMGQGIVTHSR